MSARGSVAVDERTNTLLLQDTADRLADIRRLVTKLVRVGRKVGHGLLEVLSPPFSLVPLVQGERSPDD